MLSPLKRPLTAFLIFLLIILIDQLTKSWFGSVCNEGFAFGIGNANIWILLVALIIVLTLSIRISGVLARLGFVMILAGGVGNLLDRFSFGCVRDFINVFNFPSFNLADAAITCGALLYFFSFVLKYDRK